MKCNICGNEMVEGAIDFGCGDAFWIPKNFAYPNMIRKKITKFTKIPDEMIVLRYDHYLWTNRSRLKAFRCEYCQAIVLLENDLEYEDKNLYL